MNKYILKIFYYPYWYKIKYSLIEIFKKSILVLAYLPGKKLRLNNRNWGDDVTLIIAQFMTNRYVIPWGLSLNHKTNLNYAVIGSLIPWYVNSKTVVWGSGALSSKFEFKYKPYKVCAVRGPLTREVLIKNGVECPKVYGDPALLFPFFYRPTTEKKFRIGFIPHHVDIEDPGVMNLLVKYRGMMCEVIDIVHYGKWSDFIDKVVSCSFILSSSLHGLIIADAYKIPNYWCEFNFKHPDDAFKFKDYFKSIERDFYRPYTIDSYVDINELEQLATKWTIPKIDLQALIDSCPFPDKIPLNV